MCVLWISGEADPNVPPLLGTFERLAMRPGCDPTVRTAPHPNAGEGSIGLGIRSRTANIRGVGSRGGLDLQQTPFYKGGRG